MTKIGEWLRLITPMMVVLVGGLVGAVYKDLKQDIASVQAGQFQISEKVSDMRERIAHTETQVDDMKRWGEYPPRWRQSGLLRPTKEELREMEDASDRSARRAKQRLGAVVEQLELERRWPPTP